ncbi:hypothetical protein HHI36_022342 [Cryptolaemus montrouzieri]|uniref:Uncharacterized protein n=1 Tax=Cryptolaemus montrouzieri TaxID=559131 RepID=A0ABD2N0D3_9CUCU
MWSHVWILEFQVPNSTNKAPPGFPQKRGVESHLDLGVKKPGIPNLINSTVIRGSGGLSSLLHAAPKAIGEETKDDLQESITPVELKIGIEKFKPMKNGRIIVGCQSSQKKKMLLRTLGKKR